jgi:hypothetical protein
VEDEGDNLGGGNQVKHHNQVEVAVGNLYLREVGQHRHHQIMELNYLYKKAVK